MSIKAITRYPESSRVYSQAQQIWGVLTGIVVAAQIQKRKTSKFQQPKITYGELAETIGKSSQAGRTLTRQLWIIGEYCLHNKIPTLNSIVVNRETGMPGHDVVLTDQNSVDDEMDAVANYDWAMVRQPSMSTFRKMWEKIS